MIKFRCPHCQQKLGVPPAYAGRRVRCNHCNQPCCVPHSAASPVPAAQQTSTQSKQPAPQGSSKDSGTASTAAKTAPRTPVAPRAEEDDLRLQEEPRDEQAARMEAIRQAARERSRVSKGSAREKTTRDKAAKSAPARKSDRLTLQQLIPDFLRLPLAIVFGFAATGLTILAWVIGARMTANALCFMALFVPLAAALVFRALVVERGFLMGLLCMVIGGLSIAGGKAAVAHFVVIPYFEAAAEKQVLVDLKAILADPKLQPPSSVSLKPYTRNGDYMTCAALVSLVEEGAADPVRAQALAVQVMQSSNPQSLVEFFDTATGGGAAPVFEPLSLDEGDEAMLEQVSLKLSQWSLEETELQMARRYYPAVIRISQQADILNTFKNSKSKYQLALLNTLGLFDLVWIFAGVGIGYAVTVFD